MYLLERTGPRIDRRLLACFVSLTTLALLAGGSRPAVAQTAQTTLEVGDGGGLPGDTVMIPVGITSTGGALPTAVQLDVVFDPSVVALPPGSVTCETSCQEAGKSAQASTFQPGHLRVFVFGLNDNPIPDGVLTMLSVEIDPGAPSGSVSLECTDVAVSDGVGLAIPGAGLPGFLAVDCTDADQDGHCVTTDCDDTNPGAAGSGAVEINDGLDNQCPGESGYGIVDETSGNSGFHNPTDKSEYSWPPQQGATTYEVARCDAPDFSFDCVTITTSQALWIDSEPPTNDPVFHYLNRPVAPHVGSWGQDSSSAERSNICP